MVCKTDNCCGCGACVSICPQKCIKLIPNELGVIIPVINLQECINCGLCDKTCPKINENEFNYPLKCFAAYLKDSEKKLDSASGGVAKAMYEKFLQETGSYIIGVYWDEQFNPIFKLTNKIEDIKLFQGSKYVQAFPDDIYSKAEEILKRGNRILFIAMPCQIAAAKKYFEKKKVDINNLILVDILCHGVSPNQYFKENLLYYKSKYKMKIIQNISFRSNRKFHNFHLCISYISEDGKIKKLNRYSYEDVYFNSFLDASSLRESCYSCNFSKLERVSDITIGDFLGLGKMSSSIPFEGIAYNASMILCNTQKGMAFINGLSDLNIFERPIQEAFEGGASLQKPYRKSKWREKFVSCYKNGCFVQTMKKVGGIELIKIQIKLGVIRTIKELYMKIVGMKY